MTRILRALMMVAAVLVMLAPPAEAQRTSNQANDARLREREKAKAERDARRYEKLKAFALNLYQTDIEFRDEVDEHFDNVQREQSLEAFRKNIAPPARPTVVHDGDRLRLHTGLYDNKLVADYINRVGQRLVPADSERLFAFRLVAHPIPFAETLSTGTIYISTGLVSLLDNEAHLAYVLAHEMAHVQLDHWKLKSTLLLAQEEFAQKEGRKRVLLGAIIGAAAGAAAGGATGGTASAVQAGVGAAVLGASIGAAWNSALALDWDTVQESEADNVAFKVILNRNYDVREVRTLYAALQGAVRHDQRVGLGFMGNRRRTAERIANVDELVAQTFKADIDARQGRFVVTDPEFIRVMATLRRDNGILSLYYDMFTLAKANLEYARKYRPNDPAAHYYYGKVMKLVGRTDEDRKAADEAFQRAIEFDHRERNYGAHFYRALALINQKNPSLNSQIAKELQAYTMASIRFSSEEAEHANALPANLDDMFDYLAEAGEITWRPVVPDALKAAMSNAATETQKTESPIRGTAKPVVTPVKK